MKSKVFISFLSAYLIILCISIGIYVAGYHSLTTIIQSQMEKNNIAVLEQNKLVIEQQFNVIAGFTKNIRHNMRIVNYQFINDPYNGQNTYKTYNLMQELNSIQLPSSFIYSYAILYKNSQTAFIDSSVWSITDFFNKRYKFEGLDCNKWVDLIYKKYHTNTILTSKQLTVVNGPISQKIHVIPYIYTLSDYQLNNNNAILLMINTEKINSVLEGIDLSDGGYVMIRDKSGNIITITSGSHDYTVFESLHFDNRNGTLLKDISGKKMLVTYVVSSETGWQYISAQPYTVIMAGLDTIKELITLAICLYITIVLALSLYLTRRNSAPVLGIIDIVKNVGKDKPYGSVANPYAYIKYYVEQLSLENNKFRSEVEKQKPIIIITFFERLLNGNFSSYDDMVVNAEYAGIRLEGNQFVVVLLSVEEISSQPGGIAINVINIRKEAVINSIMAMGLERLYIHNINTNRLALIFSLNVQDVNGMNDYLGKSLELLTLNMESMHSFPICITVGGIYDNAFMLSRSYSEALNIMENHVWSVNFSRQKVLFFNEYNKCSASLVSVTADIDDALLKTIKSGDHRTAEMILGNNLNSYDTQQGNITRLYLYDVISTINITINEVLLVDKTSNIENLKVAQSSIISLDLSISVEKLYKHILYVVNILCDYYNCKMNIKNYKLVAFVKEIINENYGSKNLCLQQVADSLSISVSYLSRLFKEETNENFANYVEKIRIEKAKALLKDTEMNINEIADIVGYSSANSFARAFKRINNITATDFRLI